jgi:hypothetical protein
MAQSTGHIRSKKLSARHLDRARFGPERTKDGQRADRRSSLVGSGAFIAWRTVAVLVAALLVSACSALGGVDSQALTSPLPAPALSATAPSVGTEPPAAVGTVVATTEGRFLSPLASPDGAWQADVLAYECTPVGDTDTLAYEQLRLSPSGGGESTTVAAQVINCGGLGAYGFAPLEWSADGRYLYYTDAREGVPDGQGDWSRTILRYDTLTGVIAQVDAVAGEKPVEPPAQEDALLAWQGPALFGEDANLCQRLLVTTDYRTFVGPCEGDLTQVEFAVDNTGGVLDMLAHFAPFQADTDFGSITLRGHGEEAGPAWERAVASWAQVTSAELATGHVGAANRTALAWKVGETGGLCRMLLVLTHGYATVVEAPCSGGQAQPVAAGWVDSAAWAQFDRWLSDVMPFYQDNNYLDGRGKREMSTEEAAALGEWAMTVYAQLMEENDQSHGASIDGPATAEQCPAPGDDQRPLLNAELGFCLLYPAGYTVEQTSPSVVDVVQGSIMNHIDPRVSIQVEDAAGRGLEEIAQQVEDDYGAGFSISVAPTTVGNVDAVVLDNLPGQDLNRRVVVVHNGRLYHFFFAPIGDAGSEVRAQAEELYRQVMDSLRFTD